MNWDEFVCFDCVKKFSISKTAYAGPAGFKDDTDKSFIKRCKECWEKYQKERRI